MKLDCILTAVNENELYIDFIPIFIKTWNKLYPEVDVKIILIMNYIPEKFLEYKDNIILFNTIPNVSTSFISQYIRILYPCILNYENGIMITDIDMLPMNRTYYTEHVKEYDNTKFIYLRENICFEYDQIAICYNIATSEIWKDIFNMSSINDIREFLLKRFKEIEYKEGHGNTGWCTDQIDLYSNVFKWNMRTNNLICLDEKKTKFNRLDRNTFNINDIIIRHNIKNGVYSDYHCFRPMKEYEEVNNFIFDLL